MYEQIIAGPVKISGSVEVGQGCDSAFPSCPREVLPVLTAHFEQQRTRTRCFLPFMKDFLLPSCPDASIRKISNPTAATEECMHCGPYVGVNQLGLSLQVTENDLL